jgi:hypothetical protein
MGHVAAAADCWFNPENKNKCKTFKANKSSGSKFSQEQVKTTKKTKGGILPMELYGDSEEENTHFLLTPKEAMTTLNIQDSSDEDTDGSKTKVCALNHMLPFLHLSHNEAAITRIATTGSSTQIAAPVEL